QCGVLNGQMPAAWGLESWFLLLLYWTGSANLFVTFNGKELAQTLQTDYFTLSTKFRVIKITTNTKLFIRFIRLVLLLID
ncbi:MAG: hypothetical protein WAW41_10285, partial [Methylobacter sp.]